MYKITLKTDSSINFRNTVNNYLNFSINQVYKRKNKNETNAWNTICSIMDRIDDLVLYLNQKELNTGKWNRCAFDFFEFIQQAGVLVNCIDDAFEIYNVKPQKHNTIFKSKKINPNIKTNKNECELDDEYFKYIRSLSSVHPSDTDRHKVFQEADFEVSPYVIWGGGIISLGNAKGDLIIVTYNNETAEYLTNKNIYMSEVFNYIKYKYYSLNYLSKEISKYYNNTISELRKKKIKKSSDFKNYLAFLNNLKNETAVRNPDMEYEIQEVIDIFKFKLSNNNNTNKFKKYKKALKLAMLSYYRQLQNMDFDCTSPFDALLGKLLLGHIYYKDKDYHYPLEKILYLKEKTGDKRFGVIMYKSILEVFQRYVNISEKELTISNSEELYLLSQIALYFHALEFENIVNSLIPNNKQYR